MIIGEFASKLLLNLPDIMAVTGWYVSCGCSHLQSSSPNKALSKPPVSSWRAMGPSRGWFIPNGDRCWGQGRARGKWVMCACKAFEYNCKRCCSPWRELLWVFSCECDRTSNHFAAQSLRIRCHIPACFLDFANCFLSLQQRKIEVLCHPSVCLCW